MRVSEEKRKERAAIVMELLTKNPDAKNSELNDGLKAKDENNMGMGDKELNKIRAAYGKAKQRFGVNGVSLKNGVPKNGALRNGHTVHAMQVSADGHEETQETPQPEDGEQQLGIDEAKEQAEPHLSELRSILDACPKLLAIGVRRKTDKSLTNFVHWPKTEIIKDEW
jgi:hypothetical protein